jgi:hypothetical protein
VNICTTCRQDFGGLELFDRHRVGTHAYLFSPERPDGRRCLAVDEVRDKEWMLDARGRWTDPARHPQLTLSDAQRETPEPGEALGGELVA